MKLSNVDLGNIQDLNNKELNSINGGLVAIVVGAALAWMAIGATVCWAMAEDNREC